MKGKPLDPRLTSLIHLKAHLRLHDVSGDDPPLCLLIMQNRRNSKKIGYNFFNKGTNLHCGLKRKKKHHRVSSFELNIKMWSINTRSVYIITVLVPLLYNLLEKQYQTKEIYLLSHMSERNIKGEAQGETQTSLRGLLRSHWLLDFTWTLHDIPTALSGFSNGEIQLGPSKCTCAHCALDKPLQEKVRTNSAPYSVQENQQV